MFTAPFSRMLWKEYRSLRMLWAGCALGTLGLWLLIYVVTSLSTDANRPPLELMHAFWSLALWLPAIYLLGCTVATFAGEKEERTADWLIHTARPFGSLLTAKVIWPVLSAAAMQLVLFGAAALVREYFLAIDPAGSMPADETIPELPGLATFALLEALAWGLFWSLQLTRPMPAAVLAAICIVLINLGTINLHTSIHGGEWERWLGTWGFLRVAGIAILLLADIALARRWIAGRGIEWAIPWDRFVLHRSVTHVLPAVEQAVPWRRAWQRLRWLERQSTRVFLMFTVMWTLLISLPTFFWPRQVGPGLAFLTLFFLPLFAGLTAWQGEQARFQFRFLAYRGVSPFGLWLNKLVRWLAALVIATTIVVIVNWLAHELGQAVFLNDGNISGRISFAAGQLEPVGAMTWVCAYFTLFLSAFTMALYFRRTIFAFGAGLILHIALFYWCIASYYLVFPVWLSLLPLMAWLVWCGLRHLPRWYLERSGWPWNGVIAAEWLVFPVLYVAAVTSYWVYSVPMPNLALSPAFAVRPLSAQGGSSFETEWTNIALRAEQLAAARTRLLPEQNEATVWSVPAPQWSQLEPEVRGLRDALLEPSGMGSATNFPHLVMSKGLYSSGNGLKIILSLMQLADEETAAGKFEGAIMSVRAAVRFAGALRAGGNLNLYAVHDSDQDETLYQRLQSWVQRPEVTPELVQRTLADLEKYELRWWLTDPMQLEGLYQAQLRELDRLEASMGFRRWLLKPWLARQRRLNACELSNQLRFLRTPATGSTYGGLTLGSHAADSDPAWSYLTHHQPGGPYSLEGNGLPVGLSPETMVAIRDRETRIRCTFAMMAAEGYRKKHGHLPSDFVQVIPQIASRELLTDPWSGAPLQIRSQGVPGELWDMDRSRRAADFKPNTPFVWSVGPLGLQLHPTAPHSGLYRFTATRSTTAYIPRVSYYIYPLLPDAKPAVKNDQPADALQPNGGQAEALLQPGLFAPADTAAPDR